LPQRVLLGEAIRLYVKRHARRLTRGGQRERVILKGFKSFIGDRPIDEITTACIDEYITQRLSTVSASTINRELTVIKAMFGKAIRWGLCKASPAREVRSCA